MRRQGMNKKHGEYNTGYCIEPRGLMRDLVHGARTSQMASDASGSEFYWRVSRVDKPCEETMRVGVCAAPPQAKKKRTEREGTRCHREESSSTRAATMRSRRGEQNRACVGCYSLKLTTVGRKLCPFTEMSCRGKVDGTCVRGGVLPIYGDELSQRGRRS